MPFTKPCGPCDGRGYYHHARDDTCQVCGGEGVLLLSGVPKDYAKCNPCDGRGYYYYSRKKTCVACKGTGMRRKLPVPTVNVTVGGTEVSKSVEQVVSPAVDEKPESREETLVSISHSSKDAELAQALMDLLQSGLGLEASQIRCTSLNGYRLPAGVNTLEQLRNERGGKVLIGLLTPNSLSSTYVLFELGARWGAGLFVIPLLAGVTQREMLGSDNILNPLSCHSDAQLLQLVEEMGRELKHSPQSPASYLRKVKAVVRAAESLSSTGSDPPKGR